MKGGSARPGLLCISTFEKGQAFLREAARLRCAVKLLTVDKLRDADWPKDVLAGFETMPEDLSPERVLPHVERMAKHWRFERVVALDEFDQETAALVREHLRLPGTGQTAARLTRDKLAMRKAAAEGGIAVPEFCGVVNHDELWRFLSTGRGPWLLKPRWSASAIGIRRFERAEEVWPLLEQLGPEAGNSLVERFVPGEIYHVEGITFAGELLFSVAHKYAQPPFDTMHTGGVFSTRTLPREGEEAVALGEIHARLLPVLEVRDGVTHSEFIRSNEGSGDGGRYLFLETAARVGGAYIAEVTEAGSGLNPWVEWARIEVALLRGEPYRLPELTEAYAGSAICLARQAWPDLSGYTDPEIVYRLRKLHHAGLIVRSASAERVEALLGEYRRRFGVDFYARLDAPAKATN